MAIKNLIARGIGFDDTGDSTTRFIATLGFTPGVAVVPAPTVNYQGGGGGGRTERDRPRRKRTQELFAELEQTIRATLAGEPITLARAAALPTVDLSQGLDPALDALLATAGEYEDLSHRVTVLRGELARYAAQQRQALAEDDEETWLLM